MTTVDTQLLLLPGAAGDQHMWRSVCERLQHPGERRFLGWPGFGGLPPDPAVRCFDDLVTRVLAEIDRPVDLLAQSMGGVIAMRAALERPEHVRHLVLVATSGGVDVRRLGGSEWRQNFVSSHPTAPRWFVDERRDLSDRIRDVRTPTLLLWGDADPISPVAVGKHLAELLPRAELHVVAGGDHDLITTHAAEVAPLIDRHLAR